MLLRLLRNRIVSRLQAAGATEADAKSAVAGIGDGSLIKWLFDHAGDIEQLVEGLLHLIALFGSKPTTPTASS